MKTSAGNHLKGSVLRIEEGPITYEVTVLLDGCSAQLVAGVPRGRHNILGLEIGSPVIVLIKTQDVVLITDPGDVVFSVRNQLKGTVISITEGAVTADVRVLLDGGVTLSSVITMESVRELGLQVGTDVTAMTRASNVIIGAIKKK